MIKAIESRRSIREYNPDKQVTKEQLTQLLTAAMLAPSARNTRPWEFIAITNREKLDEIVRIHPYAQMCKTATAAIIVVGIPQEDGFGGYFAQDCGAATQNILLEAADMGLATCWCGIFPREERIGPFTKSFNIPEGKVPFCVIAVGYPNESPDPRGFYEEAKASFIE
ncbi:MAG: nitroreductase family protein [Oscillospiraceae bacterium]|jgi:nitroreductase|nr:nitroreductase family protein [Oscillospiraceae bacterium]